MTAEGLQMTFQEQVIATLLGSLAGFLFAIVIFYITENIRTKRIKKNLTKNLKREFEYNISLLQEWIDEIDKILRKITANDTQVFSYLKYSYYQRLFAQESFHFGILYELYNNNEDISTLNAIFFHCDINEEQYINQIITKWKDTQIEQKKALSTFEFEKETPQKYKKQLTELLGKLR
ncbi:MAG: hypothetical protein AABY78_04435 [Nitrospirota bacterium]